MAEVIEGINTSVVVKDEPGQGGACHEYYIVRKDMIDNDSDLGIADYAQVHFQNGPIKEFGINGCHQEDLLRIVIHRLEGFQSGEFSCRENALALTKVQEALHWLEHRTADREARGVEGVNEK